MKENKLRLQYFLIGISFWIIINLIFNVYFPMIHNTFRYAYFGNYAIFVLFGFTAYAIVKRELFGIRVVLTTLLVSVIAILLALDTLVFTETLLFQVIKGVVLLLFLFFGYLLIKSVLREIKLREELRRAYVKLKQLDKAKSTFLSMASHQLRSPLTVIKGYISMILEGTYGRISKVVRGKLERVYISNERLVKLVSDLLNVSRIEAGKIEMKFEKVSLESLISTLIKELSIQAKKKGLSLKFEKPKKKLLLEHISVYSFL